MKAKYIILAVVALSALSCNKFEKLSKNPYALETNQGKAESFVQPILYKTGYNLASVFRSTTAHLMQYAITTTSDVTSRIVANYNIPEGTSDDVWSGLYIQFGNARKMYEAAVREDSKSMQAVSLVMQAMLISLITDTYGDVPFKDAGQIILLGAEANKYTTVYDSQKDIYRSIIIMLEEANALFAASEDLQFSPICDRTFGGDLDKWRRFGNALYAKVLNRIARRMKVSLNWMTSGERSPSRRNCRNSTAATFPELEPILRCVTVATVRSPSSTTTTSMPIRLSIPLRAAYGIPSRPAMS